MTAAAELVDWGLGLRLADVPETARRAAVRHLLDGLGCAVAGARSGEVAAVVTVAAGLGGPPEGSVVGTSPALPAPAAALANGALLHALDFDDTHTAALVHATAAVLPAALAVGQQVGADGAAVLEAAVVGYEAVCRIGAAAPHAFHARGVHATLACGVFSAALVAARLMELTPARGVDALGIAGSSAGGLLEFLHTGSATKQLHPGLAGSAGVLAARLAAAGATGPSTVLEGDYGLYRALADRAVPAAAVTAGLGQTWQVERITLKPYPACHVLHAALDAASRLHGEVDLSAVEEVTVSVPPDAVAIVCEPIAAKRVPRSPYEAKFSVPWSVAAMLVDGGVTVGSYAPERLARPEVLDLAARVGYAVVPYDGPVADAPGEVAARTGGSTQSRGVRGSRGGPARPLPDAEVHAKFTANCGGPSPAVDALLDAVLHLEEQEHLEDLMGLTREMV